ncbi:MAG TPA: PfkB family carbohydrate kinase [Myxococcales bacterium]|nr:PfkB family carbohydrate kinase [Myxococcales bacterium]
MPSLAQLAQLFPRRRVLVVGDLVADHYIYGQTERVSREAPVLIVNHESSEVKLGGGANAAANARSLGGQVTAVGVLGRDEMGQQLRRLFKAAGIALQAATADGLQTETKTRILAGGLNTTRQQMLRLDRGNKGPLPPRVRRELAELVADAARSADAVVVSDYGAGVVGPELRQSLRRLAAGGMTVVADSRYHLRELHGLTACKPNEPELEALTGRRIHGEAELRAAGRQARELLRCRALLVTRGRSGMAVFGEDGPPELLPVHGAEEAVDVTGAGDTVVAAFALALAAGAGYADAARLANVASGLVVMKQGTATVSRAELARELGGRTA